MTAYAGYRTLKALVVDDFDSFRTTVSNMLQELGFATVDTALNGEQAVRACFHQHYDVVLCDYNLGAGRSGQQVLEELRFKGALKRRSLFVVVSAETDKNMIMATFDYEPDAYLTKPITARTLQQRLDRLLHQRQDLMPIYAALDAGDTARAIAACEDKLQAGCRYVAACQKLLGTLYLTAGDHAGAEQLYRQVLEARALDWARVGLAQVNQARGDLAAAGRWLREVIAGNALCMPAYDALVENCRRGDDREQLQAVLQQAATISPRSILRQQDLAETAVDNNDLIVAADAYRRTVRLGRHSCHDRIENHLNFGRTAVALFREDRKVAADLCREALRVLAEIPERFNPTPAQDNQAHLIESQVYAGQGNGPRAESLLQEVEQSLAGREPDVDTALDWVAALAAVNKQPEADKLLEDLAERFSDDQAALEKIDRLLGEPLSQRNRGRVAALNRGGIAHYDKAQFKEAIESFIRAKRLFPNHIGVHLNLVQALIGEMEAVGCVEELMQMCMATLAKIETRIEPTHEQYTRYCKLREKTTALGRE
ncbi:response regulator [Exilibacterium tricleocarpae]|uniref:Response regulator n=1 Tax=Exilibacterium tricleocarpae TaxID=2591008 RepID=A0A545TM03_9GAMM|nr:tetratricopeptide repeat-containing response regulator [Exilibacterium tricleocarpae]TQV78259.1 response regulator [Exilibacterium tricleocarpae]